MILPTEWIEVTHEEFHKYFNVKFAKLWDSDTRTNEGYAMSIFSMNDIQETHKTVHNNGVLNMPNFYVNKNVKRDGLVSIKGKLK